jgi:hypothetical protein
VNLAGAETGSAGSAVPGGTGVGADVVPGAVVLVVGTDEVGVDVVGTDVVGAEVVGTDVGGGSTIGIGCQSGVS